MVEAETTPPLRFEMAGVNKFREVLFEGEVDGKTIPGRTSGEAFPIGKRGMARASDVGDFSLMRLERLDLLRQGVVADDRKAARGKASRQGCTEVTQADDGDPRGFAHVPLRGRRCPGILAWTDVPSLRNRSNPRAG